LQSRQWKFELIRQSWCEPLLVFAIDGLGFYNAGLFDSLSPGFHEAMIIDQSGCLIQLNFQYRKVIYPSSNL
jgi:hypothetical protein